MEQFIEAALAFLQYGVAFVLVLSVLVFIHEWGHYFVARRCGVKIESFSIGFGPEIFGFSDKAGTRWRFSVIPLGGYVKMFGDADPASMPTEAAAKMSEEDRECSFFHKSVGQRSAIVFAGPAANFLFAILVFTGMFMVVGETFTPARISGVVPDTPAEAAGLQAGDTVISVDGREIDRFETLQQTIRINAGSEVDLVVERNGERIQMPLIPDVRIIDDGFGGKGQIGVMGVYGPTAPARVAELEAGSRAEEAGLEPGDLIVEVDGELVQNAREAVDRLRDKAEQPVTLTVLRGVDPNVIGPNEAPADSLTLSIEIVPTAFTLPAAENAVSSESSDDSAAEEGENIAESGGEVVGTLPGISWTPLPDTTRVYRNPFHAVYRASVASYEMGANTLTALWQLASGQRSVKELGGPLKIARISGDVAQQNVMALLHFMVLLSINLGLINLLPVPVLDGGHLVFYGVEALRGKPVGLKAQEYCFRVGLALILCLMIFATWNDIMQLFVNNA